MTATVPLHLEVPADQVKPLAALLAALHAALVPAAEKLDPLTNDPAAIGAEIQRLQHHLLQLPGRALADVTQPEPAAEVGRLLPAPTAPFCPPDSPLWAILEQLLPPHRQRAARRRTQPAAAFAFLEGHRPAILVLISDPQDQAGLLASRLASLANVTCNVEPVDPARADRVGLYALFPAALSHVGIPVEIDITAPAVAAQVAYLVSEDSLPFLFFSPTNVRHREAPFLMRELPWHPHQQQDIARLLQGAQILAARQHTMHQWLDSAACAVLQDQYPPALREAVRKAFLWGDLCDGSLAELAQIAAGELRVRYIGPLLRQRLQALLDQQREPPAGPRQEA